jgi:DNA polymerase
MQNLPRGCKLRRALIAKPGETIFTIDASQIEARITAWICGQEDLVQQFANKEDVYSSFASEVFGYPVGKKTHPNERFIGKTSVLGLGFQVGAPKFSNTIEVQSQLQLGAKIDIPLEEAMHIVSLYRTKYSKISAALRELHSPGIVALTGLNPGFTFGPCNFEKGAVLLPSGLRLFYHSNKSTASVARSGSSPMAASLKRSTAANCSRTSCRRSRASSRWMLRCVYRSGWTLACRSTTSLRMVFPPKP